MSIEPKGFRWALSEDGVGTITLDRPDRINALYDRKIEKAKKALRPLLKSSGKKARRTFRWASLISMRRSTTLK